MKFVEHFSGFLSIINYLINISEKLAHTLTFLTFDVNQDGIIS